MNKLSLIIMLTTSVVAYSAPRSTKSAADYLEAARTAVAEYRPSDARELYDAYEKQVRRSKKSIPAEVEAERDALLTMENMLDRVEKIVVFDSINVDSAAFFSHYRLSAEAGRILQGDAVRIPATPMAFIPQNNTEILYSLPDSTGTSVLMGADILDDGTFDHPAKLDLDAGAGDALFPFLMADGVTLYYSADGDESLGGYDIFMTRRDDDGSFLQPQNIGMPYNSPANDYLLAIDETSGIGWWASDRQAPDGMVTIYMFRPETTRVNVDPESENLTALARLSDISLTHEPGADYSSLKQKIEQLSANSGVSVSPTGNSSLNIAVGNRVYSSLGDFKNAAARRAAARAVNARAAISSAEATLSDLREKYRKGDRSLSVQILNLEQSLSDSREEYRQAVNDAISAELSL